MLLSTSTQALARRYGDAEAIRILKKAGFDAFDLALFSMNQPDDRFNQPHYKDYAKELRAIADACGIRCNQAHAPFPSSSGDKARNEVILDTIHRAMEIAAIVGADVIVVHPAQHLPYATHVKELRAMNRKFYRALVPYCEEYGIKVAVENMFQFREDARRIVDSTCARPEEFCAYVDAAKSPWIVACLDIGHTTLTDQNVAHCIRTLGRERLQALHVHDNDLISDRHTLPYTGRISFARVTDALAEIGYTGDFTYEADSFINRFPEPLIPAALDLMVKVGRHLIAEIEQKSLEKEPDQREK